MKVGRYHNMNNNIYNINDYYKLLELQDKYDKGLIDEDDMSLEEIRNLIKLYKSQTKRIEYDIKIKLLQKKNGGNI